MTGGSHPVIYNRANMTAPLSSAAVYHPVARDLGLYWENPSALRMRNHLSRLET